MPKFSIVVPTHDPKHLRDAVDSALAQTLTDLEVVVVPGAAVSLVGALPDDQRVRVVPLRDDLRGNVGAIKRFAFAAATGEILVELDHDDLLVPDALEALEAEFDAGADFVHSNVAEFRDGSWEPHVYDAAYGWKSRSVHLMGHDLIEMIAFPETAASIAWVFYAPNHIRAWRRDFYHQIGGHNAEMPLCDDHELVIRTYLKGSIRRVDRCLYLYRVHASTSQVRNLQIQQLTHQLYATHIEALVLRWCSLEGLPAHDLGGGKNPQPGWVGVDKKGAEIAADLEQRWPFEDSSVGAFRAYDILEHMPDKMHTLSEMHRCLVPGGWVLSLTPSALGQGGFQDPTHCSFWVKNSWLYVTDRKYASYIDNATVRFQTQRLVEDFPSPWHAENNIPYVTFDGIALKGDYRGPGLVEI